MSVLLLIGLVLAAWIIDWIFVFKVWAEGIERLQGITAEDLARVNRLECWCGDLQKLASGTANVLYSAVFRVTGIHDMGARFSGGAALSIPDTIVRTIYVDNYDAIRVAMVGIQLFGVRLAASLVAVPFVALIYSVALTEGLTQRAIRRARGGRESGNLYHRAKHLQLVILATTVAGTLILPMSINPRSVWLPSAVLIAILARIQWAYYKKHL